LFDTVTWLKSLSDIAQAFALNAWFSSDIGRKPSNEAPPAAL